MKHIFSRTLVAAIALVPAAHAGTDRWTPFGPGDGRLTSLVASSRGDLYVTSAFTAAEIWQRPASASRWRWRNAGLGRPDGTETFALAVHPKKPDTLWAVASQNITSNFPGVFRSTDGGASWRRLYTGNDRFQVLRLTVATTRLSVALFAETGRGAPEGLFRSIDLGVSWRPVAGVVGPVAAPPDEPGTVYAVARSGGGLVKSTDGGRTFHPTGNLAVGADDEIRTLHATYGRPALLFASLRDGGLYRSTNGGASFRAVGFTGVGGPSALASEPGAPRKIYAIDSAFLYSSDRGGTSGSFRELATFAPDPIFPEPDALVAAPGGPYFLARGDLFRFSPPDRSAPVDKRAIEAYRVQELRISAHDPSFVSLRRELGCLAARCDVATLLSTDGGLTFSRLGAQTSAHRFSDVLDLAFDPADSRRRLAIGPVGIELTEPGGRRIVRFGLEGTVEIAADGLLLAGGPNGIFWSENDGVTWTAGIDGVVPPSPEHPLGGTRRFFNLETNPYAPDRVIAHALESFSGLPHAADETVLYKSDDAGRTWSWLRDGEADVEFVPGAPATLYLLHSTPALTAVDRSDDFGATSTRLHSFDPLDRVSDLATDPNGSGDLYAATRFGVLRSRDGGSSWNVTAGGFAPFGGDRRPQRKVQVFPGQAGRLIAAPVDGGLFENRLSD